MQILLSNKRKWLGLIIPVLNFVYAIIVSLSTSKWGASIVSFLIMIAPFIITIGIYYVTDFNLKKRTRAN